MKKNLKMVELFAGMGAQKRAIHNILKDNKNTKVDVVAICEWYIPAIVSYDRLHNGAQNKFPGYDSLDENAKWDMLDYLARFSLSNNSKDIYSLDKMAKLSYKKIRQLYIAMKRTNNIGSVFDLKGFNLPKLDIFTYSFPCQSISTAGKGEGIVEGTTSGLLLEVQRVLQELNDLNRLPKTLLMENVEALFQTKHKADWEKFASFLETLGYKNSEMVLNAQDFGIPQHRKRAFCISILDDDKTIEVNGIGSHPSIHQFLDLDNNDLIEEYKKSIPNNTNSRITWIEKSKKLNDMDYCMTISTKQDRWPNAGFFWCDNNGKLIDNEARDWNINGDFAPYRFISKREQIQLMGFESSDYDQLKELKLAKCHIQRLAGNSIVVPVLEALFGAIIKRLSAKSRVAKIVATKTKKMKAKVLQAIEELKRKNKKINPFAISKVAKISYNTARKYWKNLSGHYVATWSGGKDSTYMILELLRKKEPLNEIIFSGTRYEFPYMYEYIKKVENYIRTKYPKVKITKFNYQNSDTWKHVNTDFIVKYIGITADDVKRIKDSREVYPLVRWRVTKRKIVKRLRKMDFHKALYKHFIHNIQP